jgi:hypothetical protein
MKTPALDLGSVTRGVACFLVLGCSVSAGISAGPSHAHGPPPPPPKRVQPADNLATSFSPYMNPPANGHFSYGFQQGRGTAFEPYTAHGTILGSRSWQATDTRLEGCPGECNLPAIWKNNTTSVQTIRTLNVPPGVVAFHPGPKGELGVVRWTAPSAGTFRVSASFDPLDDTTTDVAVVHNGAEPPLMSGKVTKAAGAKFEKSLTLRAGDTLDFTVAAGDGYTYDSTGLQVVIQPL